MQERWQRRWHPLQICAILLDGISLLHAQDDHRVYHQHGEKGALGGSVVVMEDDGSDVAGNGGILGKVDSVEDEVETLGEVDGNTLDSFHRKNHELEHHHHSQQ